MFITEYLKDLTGIIEQYSKTGLILSTELKVDARTEKLGLIKGQLIFLDGSRLCFTEYLDLRYKLEKLSYVFHYQDQHDKLVFRYDNALHKPAIASIDHKHSEQGVEPSSLPELAAVLEEILQILL
jgi:hypothetical protein